MYMFPPQNPDLKPEKLMNYELSFTQRTSDGALSYGVSVYYIDGDNMIQTVPVDGRPKNINTGRIENWGVEGDAACRINPAWSVSANYSYLHMAYPVVAAPEHKLYAGANFTRRRWKASTGVQYVHGLYTSVKPAAKDNFVLWNANVTFRAAPVARSVRAGRKPAGAALRNQRRIPHAESDGAGRYECEFLIRSEP